MDSESKFFSLIIISFFIMVVLLYAFETFGSNNKNINNLEQRIQVLEEKLNDRGNTYNS